MILDLLIQDGLTPVKVANTNGGEYASPCPACGGRDRFRVWTQTGRWWCRQCNQKGDEIEYLKIFHGMVFKEARRHLGLKDKSIGKSAIKSDNKPDKATWKSKSSKVIPAKWKEKAEEFVERAHGLLMWADSQLDWLKYERGLSSETIKKARLGWNIKNIFEERQDWGLPSKKNEKGNLSKLLVPRGLVIPVYVNGEINRIKTRVEDRNSKYLPIAGGGTPPMILGQPEAECVMVVESELDAILLNQEVGDLITIVAMGSAAYKPDVDTEKILKNSKLILHSFDTDKAGAEKSWTWWRSQYPQWKRWACIKGKDPTASFQKGVNLRAWVQAGLQELMPEEAFDFFDYLLENEDPFPEEWLTKYDEATLERLAIMTIDGGLTDEEALKMLNI